MRSLILTHTDGFCRTILVTRCIHKLTSAIVIFDIDGVIRDVGNSYRRALADTVEQFTHHAYRPTEVDIDELKSEGIWNNDWEASQELIYRYFETQGTRRSDFKLNYQEIVAFFQSRYRGLDPENWTGYICDEPLLLEPYYLEQLSKAGIPWGFFSGATRASANYVLSKRLGLRSPVLIAMEDAPGKPDPTGLLAAVEQLEQQFNLEKTAPILYVGDTVGDMYAVERARSHDPSRMWLGVGVLPPHVQVTAQRRQAYSATLKAAGAIVVLDNVQDLTPAQIEQLVVI